MNRPVTMGLDVAAAEHAYRAALLASDFPLLESMDGSDAFRAGFAAAGQQIAADVERYAMAEVARLAGVASLNQRRESWEWFLTMLRRHRYEGQPIWSEAVDTYRELFGHAPGESL